MTISDETITPGNWMSVLRHDVPASLVVFLVAVPLSLGVAVASGAPVAAGLVAAVVGGVVAGALGGSVVQVSGPAAGLSLVVAELVHTYGWRATCAITVMAGLLQLALGGLKVARAALGVSPAVVHGMLAGVGVVIALSQLHIVLGGSPRRSALENVLELPAQILDNHTHAVMIGVLTIGVLLVWGRIPRLRAVPAPLAALMIATLTAAVSGWDLTKVDLQGGFASVQGPVMPQGDWHAIAGAVLLVALLAGVESLLTCVASNRLHDGPRADLDRDLTAQGVANMVSGALGGLPVAGVVVRTTTNARAGARTRWSSVLHGVWVLLFTALFAWMIALIPLEALAALLLFIGVQMVNLGHVRNLHNHREVPVYFVTMAGVVLIGLAEGVAIGLGLAALLALRRLAWVSVDVRPTGERRWRVVVTGSLTFLGVPRLTEALRGIPAGAAVELDLHLDFMDNAAFEALHAWRLEHERTGGVIDVDEPHAEWYSAAINGVRLFPARIPPRHDRWWLPWAYRRRSRSLATAGSYAVIGADGGKHDDISMLCEPQGVPDLLEGTREFQRRTAPMVRPVLHRMARKQSPSHLFITCADSRIVPNIITASGPGDLFTLRNIGNLVPRAGAVPADDSVAATIEYAVKVLGVRTITVCGHSGCGAMAALLGEVPDLPALRSWLRHGRQSLARFVAAEPHDDDTGPLDRLCRINVIQQLDNLRTHPFVDTLVQAGKLDLTGLYFDIGAARVHVLEQERFTPVPELRTG
ncbi:carbonic anhydrase [Microbispora sp. SCL1-1]|uniref:SulP family inorganic anion transporter n=1 Tax=Microbispora TaxID=2005 RepID=UPI0011598F7F|nr:MULTISPECIES: SulP family inorganic anion transporter [unclassified Microbispora]NJP23433.1 bifunctional SulP family inorganic anion transporter/carbonic anhydrase [Microbispora sp. CL1-1]TQS16486.1 carbonic anhydrase [Microbispora sp. SCL1-1]